MTQRLVGRGALVTGSTDGIGRAIAEAFAREGARVVVTGRSQERGREVVAGIAESGGSAFFVAADLSDPEAVGELARRSNELIGHVDVLVNNVAYLIPATSTADTTPDLIDSSLALSVRAPFLLTAALAPGMAARRSGSIVNVGSINGSIGMNGAALYGATKAALHSLTKSWAAEFGPSGVRVNTVAPGPTATRHNEEIKEYLTAMVARVPSRRISDLAEVAAAAVFLASDDASHVHGATLPVDGGMHAV